MDMRKINYEESNQVIWMFDVVSENKICQFSI
ncbi:hypothetical protein EZS27_027376 [termite gut metagenome]|uniref:Uncharacterized protein n=1 Tax=termite gut metagenome TaxID=433724 RepID=A0A5J4QQ03_9ZZZZ